MCCGPFPAGSVCLRGLAAARMGDVAVPSTNLSGHHSASLWVLVPLSLPESPANRTPSRIGLLSLSCPGEPGHGGWRSGCWEMGPAPRYLREPQCLGKKDRNASHLGPTLLSKLEAWPCWVLEVVPSELLAVACPQICSDCIRVVDALTQLSWAFRFQHRGRLYEAVFGAEVRGGAARDPLSWAG